MKYLLFTKQTNLNIIIIIDKIIYLHFTAAIFIIIIITIHLY